MQTTYQQQAKKKLVATVISLVIIAGIVLYANHLKTIGVKTATTHMPSASSATTASSTPSSPSSNNSSASTASSSSNASTNTSGYKDGTYTASSDYYVPHGDENIQVSLTLTGGVITNVSVQNSEADPTSASFQESFASAYKSYVVGTKISGLQLSVVSGASDTTQGFNDALSQIASKAQA
jgi:uncharacterized protein with FMN-binding domain